MAALVNLQHSLWRPSAWRVLLPREMFEGFEDRNQGLVRIVLKALGLDLCARVEAWGFGVALYHTLLMDWRGNIGHPDQAMWGYHDGFWPVSLASQARPCQRSLLKVWESSLDPIKGWTYSYGCLAHLVYMFIEDQNLFKLKWKATLSNKRIFNNRDFVI